VCNDLSNAIVQTLQTISPRGDKFFVRDGKAKGGFFALGLGDCTTEPPIVIVVCEGFATGATIHEATGYAVIVAFNAGNLQAVCTAIRRLMPDALIVVAGDDDWANHKGNTGMDAAKQAALSVGGLVVAPRFAFAHRGEKETDFNDMATALGLDAVTEVFNDQLTAWGV
jgi:putative DNA primase/helicase